MAKWERNLRCSFWRLFGKQLSLKEPTEQLAPPTFGNSHTNSTLDAIKLLPRYIHMTQPPHPHAGETVGPQGLNYILWGCSKITNFWKYLSQLLSQVTGIPTSLTPELALTGIDTVPQQLRCINTHILLAARITIVKHWKSTDHLTKREVMNLVHILMHV